MIVNRPARAYEWTEVFHALKFASLEEACVCFSLKFPKVDAVLWVYFFDLLYDPRTSYCLLNNNRKYQKTVLDFIERYLADIPKYLFKLLTHQYRSARDVEILRLCMKKFKDKMSSIGRMRLRKTLANTIKERGNWKNLPSPTSSELGTGCENETRIRDCPDVDQGNSNSPVFMEKPHGSDSSKVLVNDETTDEDSECMDSNNFWHRKSYQIRIVPFSELLKLDLKDFCFLLDSYKFSGPKCYEFPGVNNDNIRMVFDRMKQSPSIARPQRYCEERAIENFFVWVVLPFLANKEVCTSADRALISDFLSHLGFGLVFTILKSCKKQIVYETTEIVVANPAVVEDILCSLGGQFWSEDINYFLASVVKDECSVEAAVSVMHYLIECSDEKSSNSCSLAIRILASHGNHESIVKLCTEFARLSKCSLTPDLLKKLEGSANKKSCLRMSLRPAHAYVWSRAFFALQRGSSKWLVSLLNQGLDYDYDPPWFYFFDFLSDPCSDFCFLKNERMFQETVITFIENETASVSSISKFQLERFSHILSRVEDVEKIKACIKKLEIKMPARSLDSATELKRKCLSSVEIPGSKKVCSEKSKNSDRPDFENISVNPVPSENSDTSKCTNSQITDMRFILTERIDSETFSEENTKTKIMPLKRLLELDNSELISHLLSGYDHTEIADVSYEQLTILSDRIKDSPTALQKFISLVIVPFLASRTVCNQNDSFLLSNCFGLDSLDYVVFVMEILRTCRTQIIERTAEILSVKSAFVEEILCEMVDFQFWSEDITSFLALVISDDCSVTAVEHVMQYLIECSDELSSNTCNLVLQILISHGKNKGIVKLCTEFKEHNKSFLHMALFLKLRNTDILSD